MSPQVDGDEDLKALRGLGPIEPRRDLADRVSRQGRVELETATRGTWWTRATWAWTRVGLPAALAVTVVAYLSWAVGSASALYR